MAQTNRIHTVPRFRAIYVLEARVRNMLKFFWVLIAIAVLNPLLYLISFGLGVGSLISSHLGSHGIDGVSYLTFIAPALLASGAIQSSIDDAIFPTLDGFKWAKLFYGMNATPQSGSTIATGAFLSGLLRTTVGVCIYSIVLGLFGVMPSPRAYLAIPISIFAGSSLGAVMLAWASKVQNEDLFLTIVGRFIIGPMFLFSGTFFPLNSLPLGLRFIGWISPLWHATELGRYAMYGHPISDSMLAVHFLFLLIMLVVGLFFAFRNFARRLGN